MTDKARQNAEITQLLIAWSDGRHDALEDLMPIVYADLRRVAAGYMRREAAGHALQPTALVHEAYVRLIDQKRVKWRNRQRFNEYWIARQFLLLLTIRSQWLHVIRSVLFF
mgnify:CR=1 FL=1